MNPYVKYFVQLILRKVLVRRGLSLGDRNYFYLVQRALSLGDRNRFIEATCRYLCRRKEAICVSKTSVFAQGNKAIQ